MSCLRKTIPWKNPLYLRRKADIRNPPQAPRPRGNIRISCRTSLLSFSLFSPFAQAKAVLCFSSLPQYYDCFNINKVKKSFKEQKWRWIYCKIHPPPQFFPFFNSRCWDLNLLITYLYYLLISLSFGTVLYCTLLYPSFCDPLDYSCLGWSVHMIFQARILKWVAISSSRGFSQPRDQTCVFCVSCIGRLILYS